MDTFAASYSERLHERVKSYISVLEGLPEETLDWVPGPEMNSLAVLATHCAGSLRYMIGDVIAGDDSGRVREAEFRASGSSAQALQQRLEDVLRYSQGVISKIDNDALGEIRHSPQHKTDFTVAMSLLRALDHVVEHLGHAQMTRLLWEQEVKRGSALDPAS